KDQLLPRFSIESSTVQSTHCPMCASPVARRVVNGAPQRKAPSRHRSSIEDKTSQPSNVLRLPATNALIRVRSIYMQTASSPRRGRVVSVALLHPALYALLVVFLVLASAFHAGAQGCILARSPQQGLPTGQGGVLAPGHFQITIGERHQFSYQHYVGDVYQE